MLTHKLVEQLKELGRQAHIARNQHGCLSEVYLDLIQEINAVTDNLRCRHPAMFWKEESPEYKVLARKWALRRPVK